MNIFAWLVVGALVGWMASFATGKRRRKVLRNIAVGVGGSLTGGILATSLGSAVGTRDGGLDLGALFVCFGSAVLVLTLISKYRHDGRGYQRTSPNSSSDASDLKEEHISVRAPL